MRVLEANLLILDMDVPLLGTYQRIHQERLARAKKVGAILDLATSDVTLYIYAKSLKDAQYVETSAQYYKAHWEGVPKGYKVYWA